MVAPWRYGTSPWVIAEVGVNHNGSTDLAMELVDAAASAGADAVKFQTFNTADLVSPTAPTASYQRDRIALPDQASMLIDLELPLDAWPRLAAAANGLGLGFMSTAFDDVSLALVDSLEPVAHKVPSGEITNLGFIGSVAAYGRPVLISTGMSDIGEVRAALKAAASAPAVAVLHCVSAYPAPVDQLNLRSIPYLAEELHVDIGWSDHTLGPIAGVAAVALGAVIVERHITLDRSMRGPDHAASLEPEEFSRWVAMLRDTAGALGRFDKLVAPAEEEVRDAARRSWHAAVDLRAGAIIGPGDAVPLRPGFGLGVDRPVVGRRVAQRLRKGQLIQARDLVPEFGRES